MLAHRTVTLLYPPNIFLLFLDGGCQLSNELLVVLQIGGKNLCGLLQCCVLGFQQVNAKKWVGQIKSAAKKLMYNFLLFSPRHFPLQHGYSLGEGAISVLHVYHPLRKRERQRQTDRQTDRERQTDRQTENEGMWKLTAFTFSIPSSNSPPVRKTHCLLP